MSQWMIFFSWACASAAIACDATDEEQVIALHARKTELFQQALRRTRLSARPGVRRLIAKVLNADMQIAIASIEVAQ